MLRSHSAFEIGWAFIDAYFIENLNFNIFQNFKKFVFWKAWAHFDFKHSVSGINFYQYWNDWDTLFEGNWSISFLLKNLDWLTFYVRLKMDEHSLRLNFWFSNFLIFSELWIFMILENPDEKWILIRVNLSVGKLMLMNKKFVSSHF